MSSEKYSTKIVFTASKSWFGWLIRKITHSSVSHVFLLIPIWGREFAVESTVGGVRIVPKERVWHHVESVWSIKDTSVGALRAGLETVINKLGTPYDWAGSFFLGILCIVGDWFKVKWQRLRWRTRAIKCSELVAIYLRALGFNIPIEIVTPDDIRRFVETQKIFERVS